MIQFPRSFAAAFLSRMADKAPVLVREIIESANPTENPRVHEEYVKAALQMPSLEARGWVRLPWNGSASRSTQ